MSERNAIKVNGCNSLIDADLGLLDVERLTPFRRFPAIMMSTDLTFEGSIWLNRSCKGMVMIYGFTLVFQVASRMNRTTEAELVQRGVNSARFDLQEPNNGYVK